jgi:hypothetical protein
MNRLLITAVCAAIAFPTVSTADDHGHDTRAPSYQQGGDHRYNTGGRYPAYGHAPRYYNYGGYRPYYYGNGYPYGYGYGYSNGHHSNNDDALWAIGGLVVGAIIGNAVAKAAPAAPSVSAAPAQQYCDRIEYDSAGNPYVERSCNR